MPISLETVRAIARLLPESDLAEISVQSVALPSSDLSADAGTDAPVHLTLRRAASVAAQRPATATAAPAMPGEETPVEAAPTTPAEIVIMSPSVGIFRPAPTPLQVGDMVKIGQVVGAVESLKVPSEVKAQAAGRVRSIGAEDGQGVEYGQPLFVLEPTS